MNSSSVDVVAVRRGGSLVCGEQLSARARDVCGGPLVKLGARYRCSTCGVIQRKPPKENTRTHGQDQEAARSRAMHPRSRR